MEQDPCMLHYLAIYALFKKKKKIPCAFHSFCLLALAVTEGRCFNSAALDHQPTISAQHYLDAIPTRAAGKTASISHDTA